MPVRRLNFTGRKRIKREDIEIHVSKKDNENQLQVVITLDAYNFPKSATVHLEAYKRTNFQRFDMGTVGGQFLQFSNSLIQMSSPHGLKYRLKVVDAEKQVGRILGEIDKVRAVIMEDVDATEESLLPVEPSHDLGEELYRLEFGANEIHLLINAELENWRAVIKDSYFVTLVFPNLIRQILLNILLVENTRSTDDDSDIRSLWLKWAVTELRARPVPVEGDFEEDMIWIEECVKSFCRTYHILNMFCRTWGRG